MNLTTKCCTKSIQELMTIALRCGMSRTANIRTHFGTALSLTAPLYFYSVVFVLMIWYNSFVLLNSIVIPFIACNNSVLCVNNTYGVAMKMITATRHGLFEILNYKSLTVHLILTRKYYAKNYHPKQLNLYVPLYSPRRPRHSTYIWEVTSYV